MISSRSRSAPFLFPSSSELEAAEALLLLSNSVKDDARLRKSVCRSSSLDSLSSINEQSPVHSSITDSLSSMPIESQIQRDPLLILSIAASLHHIDTMTMQKAAKNLIKQGQAQFSKPRSKPTYSDDVSSECSAASTLTSTNSVASHRRVRAAAPETRGGPMRLWRRGEQIIEFLMTCGRGVTEVEIRKELGNGPDTSKALRLLMKHAEVKRSGAGGRKNPYLYMPNRH
ncbi:hypothetical protein LUZ60_014069 [Juncus effusus]|nr:hypothetical protein LUZ60_014069 [Juncus effusus]